MATAHFPHTKDDTLTLDCVLTIYSSQSNIAITRARVDIENGQPVLRNPEIVTEDFLTGLLKLTNRRPLMFLPENVVAMTHDACAWFIPAQERILLFNARSDSAINSISGQVFPQPPLLFITRGGSLSIYALAENRRPGPDTPVYLAPYWNTSTTVCMGNSGQPLTGGTENIAAWEQAFYGSNFTHPNGKKAWTNQFTHLELWQAAQAAGEFNSEWLEPAHRTVAQVIASTV